MEEQMPLQITYRPSTLDEFAGNIVLKEGIASILARPPENRPHAYLLCGPSGTGKTTIARILAKAFGCEDIDLYEYNSANHRGIDTVRDLIEKAHLAPKGPCKFYILDEFHQVTQATQEASLKMLEDVPKNCYYVLATTNPEKLLPTIKTRVTTFTTQPLTMSEMSKLLITVAKQIQLAISNEVLTEIIKVSEGCAREALKLLDQVMTMQDPASQLELIKRTAVGESEVIDLCRRLFKQDSGYAKWVDIRTMLANLAETDPERIRRGIYGYLGGVQKKTKSGQGMMWILLLQEEFAANVFNTGRAGLENMCCKACLVTFPK
jgi:DNA polymerase III subunit gamma/tau